MAPSGHSSSSHSSHSSSSHSSSFSSHSSSFGSSRSSSSRGPSSHSSSSWSSRPSGSSSSYTARPSRPKVPAPTKPRVNQPMGFRPFSGYSPTYHYGRRHEYIYYPVAWVDSSTGRSYEKGYYDENGQHYDNVAFEKNGKYENVVCHCPYCGQDTILNLASEDAAGQSLQCPSCGAPMEISSQLDEQASAPIRTDSGEEDARRRRRIGCLVALVIAVALLFIGTIISSRASQLSSMGHTQVIYSLDGGDSPAADLSGDTLELTMTGDHAYTLAEGGAADKTLVWDEDADSYYDEETDCWLWYNTDVEPPVWQYWYEGISSDYGDYGWMEHDDTGWYIEESNGNWIPLPSRYDTAGLWYLED